MDILVEHLIGLGCGAGLLASVDSNGGTVGISGNGLVGGARVGDDGCQLHCRFWLGRECCSLFIPNGLMWVVICEVDVEEGRRYLLG